MEEIFPGANSWLKDMQAKLEELGFHTGEDEFVVILMRLMDPDEWPEAAHWSGWKGDL